MTPPLFARHLTVGHTCDGTTVVFTLTNTEPKPATNVVVKRSDGTEHGVARLEPFATLTERIEGPAAWVSVWAVFPTRVWHRRIEASCAPEPTTTAPVETTVPVATTARVYPSVPHPTLHAVTVQRTTPTELAHTGAGDALVTVGWIGAAALIAGALTVIARRPLRGGR